MCNKYLIFILISVFKYLNILLRSILKIRFSFKLKKTDRLLNNEDGIAVIETIPLLSIFIFLMTYAIGYWGSIHSGVLSAIGARTYALETFRNRSHLAQFRESKFDLEQDYISKGWQMRLHRVVELSGGVSNGTKATKLPISFNNYNVKDNNIVQSAQYHNGLIDSGEGRSPSSLGYEKDSTPTDTEIWLQVGYGYCLTFKCGDQ